MGVSQTETAPGPLLEAGELLAGRFRLIRELGSGGVGIVWLAEDEQLENEEVACKVLRDDLSVERDALSALKREVLLTRKLRHPSILAVYTFWEDEASCFLTMEFVSGKSLSDELAERGRPFTLKETLPWVRQLAEALDYAHSQGVLHRDIKPANILLSEDRSLRLGDFGIASMLLERDPDEAEVRTQGTLFYMSPERLSGGNPDLRSDLYSLAATVYQLLNGTPPFHTGDILAQIQIKPAPPIEHLDEAINRVILKALSKSPEKRQSSCGDFYNALVSVAAGASTAISPSDLVDISDADRSTVVLGDFSVATRRTRLGRLLIEEGTITQEQLANALLAQAESGDKLGAALVGLGYVTEEMISLTLSRQLQVPMVRLSDETIEENVACSVSRQIVEHHLALPLRRTKYGVLVAMFDPLDMEAINILEGHLGVSIDPVVATESDLRDTIERIYSA